MSIRLLNYSEKKGNYLLFMSNLIPLVKWGGKIHPLLDHRLEGMQAALERELVQTTIADLLAEL